MIRIAFIKPLPTNPFSIVNGSYCMGTILNDRALQAEAGIQDSVRFQSVQVPPPGAGWLQIAYIRMMQKAVYGYQDEISGNVLCNSTFPVCL